MEITRNSFVLNKGCILDIAGARDHSFSANLVHSNFVFNALIQYTNTTDVIFASNNLTKNRSFQKLTEYSVMIASSCSGASNCLKSDIRINGSSFKGNEFGGIVMITHASAYISNAIIHSNNIFLACFWTAGKSKLHIEKTFFILNRGNILKANDHSVVTIASSSVTQTQQLDPTLPSSESKIEIAQGSTLQIDYCTFKNNSGNLIHMENLALLKVDNTNFYYNKGQYVIFSDNSTVHLRALNFHGNHASEKGTITVRYSHLSCEATQFRRNYHSHGLITSVNSNVFVINCNITLNHGKYAGVFFATELSVISIKNSAITFNQGEMGVGYLWNSSAQLLSCDISFNGGIGVADGFMMSNSAMHIHQCELRNWQKSVIISINSTVWIAFSELYITEQLTPFARFEKEKAKQISLWTFNSSFDRGGSRINTHSAAITGKELSVIDHTTEKFVWKEAKYASCK